MALLKNNCNIVTRYAHPTDNRKFAAIRKMEERRDEPRGLGAMAIAAK
jgi:hypothetical protein